MSEGGMLCLEFSFFYRSNSGAAYIGLSSYTYTSWATQHIWTNGRAFVNGLSYNNFQTTGTIPNTGKQCVSVTKVSFII